MKSLSLGKGSGLLLGLNRLFFCLAAAVTIWIYHPVLDMPFQDDDQIDYFAEMNGSRSLAHGLSLMDYSLKRQYAKGDEFLYRPLLFAWLALEHRIFFYHHRYWNIATLALHLGVIFLFFRFMREIAPGPPAWIFTAWFLTSYNLSYLIMRGCHAAGYIWAIGLFILALHSLWRILQTPYPAAKDIVFFLIAATLCGFFLEVTMLVLTGMALVGLMIKRFESQPAPLRLWFFIFVPLAIYLCFYVPRIFMAHRFFFVDSPGYHLFSLQRLAEWPQWILVFFKIWVLKIKPPRIFWILILEGALVFLVLKALSREHLKKRIFFATAVPVGALIYAAVLCFARQTPLFYHDYFFVAMGILGCGALVDGTRLTPTLQKLGVLLAGIFVLQNAFFAHSFVQNRFSVREASQYFNQLIRFVDEHRSEKDFSFRIVNPPEELEGGHPMPVGYPDSPETPVIEKYWAEIIFAPYWKREGARYELRWENDKIILLNQSQGS